MAHMINALKQNYLWKQQRSLLHEFKKHVFFESKNGIPQLESVKNF